jgi:DNA mismatch endonuclease (patch repair protein)
MSRIRARGNRETELIMVGIFRRNKIRGWRRHLSMPGCPDFAFPKSKVAVFVDGCFWHGCPKHGRNPDSNQSYWKAKMVRNKARDNSVTRNLRQTGWRVLRFWQHDLQKEKSITKVVQAAIGNPNRS